MSASKTLRANTLIMLPSSHSIISTTMSVMSAKTLTSEVTDNVGLLLAEKKKRKEEKMLKKMNLILTQMTKK